MTRAYIVDGRATRLVTIDEATQAIGTATFVWVHLNGGNAETKSWLEARNLDHVVINALLATETRPRLDLLEHGAILNLRGPDADPDSPDLLASIRVWATKGWAVSVTLRDLASMSAVDAQMAAGQILDPGDLVWVLASTITAQLDPEVAALGDTVDDCEEMLEGEKVLKLRRSIAQARATAIAYRRFVAPQRGVLEQLATVQAHWLSDEDRVHLREAADRAARMAEELEAIRERAALLHEQLTDLRSETIERRGLVISIVALIFLPLTFLTGLIGMNVEGIPFAKEPWAFWAIVAVSLAIAVSIAGYFFKARWFR